MNIAFILRQLERNFYHAITMKCILGYFVIPWNGMWRIGSP